MSMTSEELKTKVTDLFGEYLEKNTLEVWAWSNQMTFTIRGYEIPLAHFVALQALVGDSKVTMDVTIEWSGGWTPDATSYLEVDVALVDGIVDKEE